MPHTDFPPHPHVYYVSFASAARESPLNVTAQLRVPTGADQVPAVVIVHGTSGVDSRGAYHAGALNDAGIATLELDMWTPRGLCGGTGPQGRPQGVPETLPDAFGALDYLASRADINARCIGIMGFSWGGVVSMLTATRPYSDMYMGDNPLRFAAHAPFYPVCWGYNRIPGYAFADLVGAPVFIQCGECDQYDSPDSCRRLVDGLDDDARSHVSVRMYPGAHHAFNRLEPPIVVNDPFSHLGKGGQVRMVAEPMAAEASRQATVDFFRDAFAVAGQAPKGDGSN